MNRNQWFVFAFVLILMFLFFILNATLQAHNANMIFHQDMTVVDSNLFNALTLRSAIYGSFGTMCFGLSLIFWICGYLEKKH